MGPTLFLAFVFTLKCTVGYIVLCCDVLHIVVCLFRMCVQVSFLKDLSGMWRQFDDRLLHHRVLPPVVSEMRNSVVALAALPLVLEIMGDMKPEGFAARSVHTYPVAEVSHAAPCSLYVDTLTH